MLPTLEEAAGQCLTHWSRDLNAPSVAGLSPSTVGQDLAPL